MYDQGAERTFAFDDGGSDRNDIRTLSFEGVRQAQNEHAIKWRMKSNDIGDIGGDSPGEILCGEIRDAYYEERDGGRRRLQAPSDAQVVRLPRPRHLLRDILVGRVLAARQHRRRTAVRRLA